jgi:Tol biopolymer transport system component
MPAPLRRMGYWERGAMTKLRNIKVLLSTIVMIGPLVLLTAQCGRTSGDLGVLTVSLTEGTNMAASVSPDGETIVLALQGILWSMTSDGGEARRLTGWDIEATWPGWSPDGSQIVFQNYSDHYYHVWTMAPDGSDLRQITSGHFDHREPTWSPDGRQIAFSSDRARSGSYDIWTIDVETGLYERRTRSELDEHSPAWSADGSRIAYANGSFINAVNNTGHTEELASSVNGDVRVPSWSPDGEALVYQDSGRQIVVRGQAVTSGEDTFPFAVSWLPDGRFLYTADGKLKVRDADGSNPREVPFRAELVLRRPAATHRKDHRFDYRGPRPLRGIFSPVLSPEGNRVAFVALGDLWVLELGEEPVRLTNDTFIEWTPSWSPDGNQIYFSSDRHGDGRPDLYVVGLATRRVRRVSVTPNSRMIFPVISPNGKSFAYIDGADQSLRVHDIASGDSRRVAERAYAQSIGKPTWSPDGQTIVLADIERSNTRFREGRNLIRAIDVQTGQWAFHEPAPLPDHLSERFEAGPAWSPDGNWLAFIMNSTLHVIPVTAKGVPMGTARQLTQHAADMPSWGQDSRTILYVSNGDLKTIQVDGTAERDIPLDLNWTSAVANGVTVIHASGMWDGLNPVIHQDVEIRIVEGRITDIRPIRPDSVEQAETAGARLINASGLTVMPGLWDAHVHPQVQDFTGQWWAVQLAYGLTTVLSNGVSTYHTMLARESLDTGQWIGPRLLTSPIYDGQRTYYGHHRSVKNEDVLALELAKARALEMDYLKAYVRAPAPFMRVIADAAEEMGVPNGSHFLSPGIQTGMGGTTHLSATQRLGYSWAQSAGGRSYQDVIDLYSKGNFHLSSTHSQTNNVLGDDRSILEDPRLLVLMPPNYVESITAEASSAPTDAQRERIKNSVVTPAAILRAGGLVTIGTDTPGRWPGLSVHAQLRAFAYGVTNHEALQSVTINAAKYSYADRDLGSIETGKIADLIIIRGNPLEDVTHAANVELVMKNGLTYTVDDILRPYQ